MAITNSYGKFLKTYTEALQYSEYVDRLNYLKLLDNNVNSPRYMSMQFYKSKKWLLIRQEILQRDLGCDLGVYGLFCKSRLIVHHINPITDEDIRNDDSKLYDLDNLITVSHETHNAIHYKPKVIIATERKSGDTLLW